MSDEIDFEQALQNQVLKDEATRWWQMAYAAQMRGDLDEAIKLYTQSIEIYPTAEAYTFRGWAKSYQGHIDEAIAECQRAIETDPDFGNPYNDIGAYLMEKGDDWGAIPWLEKALQARRYECYFYAHYNLGRIYEKRNDDVQALRCYKAAYLENRQYTQALRAFRRLQAKLS